jgi:hypothetical protein
MKSEEEWRVSACGKETQEIREQGFSGAVRRRDERKLTPIGFGALPGPTYGWQRGSTDENAATVDVRWDDKPIKIEFGKMLDEPIHDAVGLKRKLQERLPDRATVWCCSSSIGIECAGISKEKLAKVVNLAVEEDITEAVCSVR